jgi:hypothetical protein
MLVSRLNTDELKVTFWENIYNAYLLIMLQEQVDIKNILKRKRVRIARLVLSLNDIEYGILRKLQYKKAFLRIYASFYYSFAKDLAVEDARMAKMARLDKKILQSSENL